MQTSKATTKLPELLAPAGSLDALLAGVAAGADANYVGIGNLNARVSAHGFTYAELAQGCAIAHKRGVRVYGAINIFLYDEEFDYAFSLVERAMACGVDAFIVADLGLIDALTKHFPNIEIHLSTQAGVHAPEGVKFLTENLKLQRITTARELSVPEIAELCALGMPIEVFCQGAICISYSGECSFSALRRGRSAMRGDCTQPCRSSYDLVDEDGNSVNHTEGDKLLCPRDYLGIAHLEELCQAGVASLKIEGRMKNPEYVYNTVRVYREALDAIAAGKPYDTQALTERLAHTFNRSFTDIYLRGAKAGAELMSFERSINQGVKVGRVVETAYQKLYVAFDADVSAGSTLEVRFYPGEHSNPDVPKRWPMLPCPIDVRAGETIFVRCKRKVESGADVYLTRDEALVDETTKALEELRSELDTTEPISAEIAAFDQDETPAAQRSTGLVEALDGAVPPQDAIVLEELLRNNNRASIMIAIEDAAKTGAEVVCRNISEVPLCQAAGVVFSCAKPIFCSNSHTEALLKGWGAKAIYMNDSTRQLMVMEHCILSAEGPCTQQCATCERRKQKRRLKEQDGTLLDVLVDEHGRSRLYWRNSQ